MILDSPQNILEWLMTTIAVKRFSPSKYRELCMDSRG